MAQKSYNDANNLMCLCPALYQGSKKRSSVVAALQGRQLKCSNFPGRKKEKRKTRWREREKKEEKEREKEIGIDWGSI